MGKTLEDKMTKRSVGEKVKLKFCVEKDSVKSIDGENNVFEAIITTSNTDRHNEQIITTGIDTSTYMNNPVVLWGHDYYNYPIGKSIKLTEMKNKIKAKFQLAVEEDVSGFVQTLANLVKGGYINAVSIGGIVKKWSEDFRTIEEMEMVEFSLVSVPANADAVISSRSLEESAGMPLDDIQKQFEKFSRAKFLDKVKDMGDDELQDTVKVLKNLVVRLEDTAKGSSLNDAKAKRHIRLILADAKAVANQSQKVITTVKLRIKE